MDAIKTGEFLAALRRSHGYTQQQVAEQLNLSNKTISKWESGNGFPDVTVLPALAELYGVTADDILAGERLHRTEEQPTAARHSYLLSRTALRFKICLTIAMVIPLVDTFSLLGNGILALQRIPMLSLHPLFVVASLVVLVVGALLAHNDLQSAAEVCTAEEIAAARLTFIRQGFALAVFDGLCLSYYLYTRPVLASLPIILILVAWYLLHRRCGRILSRASSILLLLSCLCMPVHTTFYITGNAEYPVVLLLLLSLFSAAAVLMMQILSNKSIIDLLKEKPKA